MTDHELRARRAEWVFVIAMLLTLAPVATQRLFLDAPTRSSSCSAWSR